MPLHNPSEFASGAVRGVRSRSLASGPPLSDSCGGGGGGAPPYQGPPWTHGPPRSQDQRATSMPLASRAEFDGTNSFIFNEMSTLPRCWLLERDGHLDKGKNVSFTR